jgi:hypothetical protein
MWHVWGTGEAYRQFWWGNLRERGHWGNPGIDGRIISSGIFRKWYVELWTGLVWLNIEKGGSHLLMR